MGSEQNATWLEMLKRLPTAFDSENVRAERGNQVLADAPPAPPQPVSPGFVESSNSPRQLQAQAAFDAHMAEIARLRAQPAAQAPMPAPTPDEAFDPNSYTTYKRP